MTTSGVPTFVADNILLAGGEGCIPLTPSGPGPMRWDMDVQTRRDISRTVEDEG